MTTGTGSYNLGDAIGRVIIDPKGVLDGMRQAQDAMRQGFQGMSKSITRAGDGIAEIGANLTALTAPITLVGAVGLKTFGSFDDALTEIQARTGALPDQMDAVRAMALKMGKDTSFSATQSAEAMLQLLSSGYDLEETFAALPATLNAAAAGGMDLGYTADVITDALAMFNMEADQAGRVADAMASASAASSAEMGDLAQGLGNVGPMAAQFGLSIEDTTAILAAFSERGIKGAEAGTQLRSMLNNMSQDIPKVTKQWKALGISMFDATGQVRPLNDVMGELRERFATMSEEERIKAIKTLAGSYGQLGLSVLTSSDAMGDMLALMGEQADAATVAEARLTSWNGMVSQLTSTIQTGLIVAMTGLIENTLKPAVERVTALLNKLIEWMQANPKLTSQIVAFLAVLSSIGPIMVAGGKALALFGKMLGAVMSPIGLLIAAGAALYIAYKKNFLGLKDFIDPVLNAFEYVFFWLGKAFKFGSADGGGIFGGIAASLRALFYVFEDGKTTFFSKILEAFGMSEGAAQRVGLAIVAMKNQIVDAFNNHVMPIITSFVDFLEQAWDIVKPGLTALADWFVETALPAIADFIADTVLPGVVKLIDIIGAIWEWTKPKLLKFLDWFVNKGLPAVIDFIEDDAVPAVQKLIDWLKKTWDDVEPKLKKLHEWFVTDALPAIQRFIEDDAVPAVQKLIDWLKKTWDDVEPKLKKLHEWFTQTALPAIRDFINNQARPAVEKLLTKLKKLWDDVRPKLESLHEWFTQTALPAIRDFINNTVVPTVQTLINKIKEIWDIAGPKLRSFYNFVNDKIKSLKTNVFDPIANAIQSVIDKVSALGDAFSKIGDYVPDWLIPGSPTPFEIGLRGIGSALSDLSDVAPTSIGLGPTAPTLVGAGAGGGMSVTINVPIDSETMRRNPDAEAYGQRVGDGLARSDFVRQLRFSGGGGVVNG